MSQTLDINEFLKQAFESVIIDVRTPKEFEQGHIPGAINIPLFTNEERVIVGTIYKKEGRQPAILKGLEMVGPKMANIVLKAQEVAKNNTVFVHCWRGGMRSGSVAWLLRMYGLNVSTLLGGYKQFRKLVLNSFDVKQNIKILGGRTGSGKTQILKQLTQKQEGVIDLEYLANHKGSAFGGIQQGVQPSQEQFENEIYAAIQKANSEKDIWLEDESRLVGLRIIPLPLWEKMRSAPIYYIEIPFDTRMKKLLEEYGDLPKELLEKAILGISRRMGPEKTGLALKALQQNDLQIVCKLCLEYYDKTYDHGMQKRENPKLKKFNFDKENFEQIAEQLIKSKWNIN